MNFLIFGGTTEGRLLAQWADSKKIKIYISVTSDYGEMLLPKSEFIVVQKGKMTATDMEQYILKNNINIVVDATHPFAKEVSKNIKAATDRLGIKIYRIKREENEKYKDVLYFEKMQDIVNYINEKTFLDEKVFFTTGSNELSYIEKINHFKDRCVVRILDVDKIIEQCKSVGIKEKHIIAKRGPFSLEENIRDFSKHRCRYLVTKESGNTGGYLEKIEAARECNMKILALKRPEEEGISIDEMKKIIMLKKDNDDEER